MKYRIFPPALALAGCALTGAAAAAPAPAHHTRGTIAAISTDALSVNTPTGTVRVPLNGKTAVLAVVPADASAITPGTFIGTANIPAADGPARALEVVVFPPALKGTGEGDYGWDLAPRGGHGSSSMTNGTVMGAPKGGSTMTNATVMSAHQSAGIKTVRLAYAGGTKTVAIGDVPIVRIMPGKRSELVVGAHVVVFPPDSGRGPAAAVVVGEHGATPPM